MRRTSAVLASIHAVEPVSIFTQISFTCPTHRLGNADFVHRAPEEVVEENRERLAAINTDIARLEAALQRIEA